MTKENVKSGVGYFYPRWMKAKMKLYHSVLNAQTKSEISDAIDKWFQETIFEVGFTQTTSRYELERIKKMGGEDELKNFQTHQKRRAVQTIAEEILNNDLYRTEINDGYGMDAKLTVTIAVVGLPRFIQDKNKVLKYVRD